MSISKIGLENLKKCLFSLVSTLKEQLEDLRKISQNNEKVAQLQNQVSFTRRPSRGLENIYYIQTSKKTCHIVWPWSTNIFPISATDSLGRPMTFCGPSRTRWCVWGRATRRWWSPWVSWRAWTVKCKRKAVRRKAPDSSWRKSYCSYRPRWTLRGEPAARAQRRSENCRVRTARYLSWHKIIFCFVFSLLQTTDELCMDKICIFVFCCFSSYHGSAGGQQELEAEHFKSGAGEETSPGEM